MIFLFLFFVLFGVCCFPSPSSIRSTRHIVALQQTRQIGLCLFCYAQDNTEHGNAYPDGSSSTEIFQKLLDKGYATDPELFYMPMPGKIKPVPDQKLKPENVCFDVTSAVEANSPDLLPVVFTTGYKITYAPGSSAVPAIKPYPQLNTPSRTWSQWWDGMPSPSAWSPGIAVFYKGNLAKFMKLENADSPNAAIPNFIAPDYQPDGKTYRQLTPDGPLDK